MNKLQRGIEEFMFEYSLFLITSARGLIDEPRLYGSLRLVDGISRLTELYSKADNIEHDQFLLKMKGEIETNLDQAMKSDEEFIRFMDELIVQFVEEMKKRYERSGQLPPG